MAAQCISGIYEIVNVASGKRYIGSAVNLQKRWDAHRYHLARGDHHSPHLQASWEKYGRDAFEFRVLLFCPITELLREEQAALDAHKPEYNIAPFADSPRGVPLTAAGKARLSKRMMGNTIWVGRKHSADTLAKMSECKRGNPSIRGKKRSREAVSKTAAAHRGMKRSPETRAKISAAALKTWADRKAACT